MPQTIGRWRQDAVELPCFSYEGALPYRATMPNGQPAHLPEDPWFLLGNDQLTLFTHVSGEYELLTGQRAWGRMNQGESPNSSVNTADVTVTGGGETRFAHLVGMQTPENGGAVSRLFGCGFAQYRYRVGAVDITRKLSVKATGEEPGSGSSAFLLEVAVRNTGKNACTVAYNERILANFREVRGQRGQNPVLFDRTYCEEGQIGTVTFTAKEPDVLFAGEPDTMCRVDYFPPALFMAARENMAVSYADNRLCAGGEVCVPAGETRVFAVIIGYAFPDGLCTVASVLEALSAPDRRGAEVACSAFAATWQERIPLFADEPNPHLRREMRWHAYTLEAMATYSRYYGETKIPQGTFYDYDSGTHASARDHLQHALPLVYTHPALAKSTLRYLLGRTTPTGEVRLMEAGYGFGFNDHFFVSDQQLFLFLLLAEYLRVTADYGFLTERVTPYPARGQEPITVLAFMKQLFLFLRDEVGTGAHGLVRLGNSDWNDAVYFILNAPYNQVVHTGESHMNTALALVVFAGLTAALEKAEKVLPPPEAAEAGRLREAFAAYRARLSEAFLRDLGDRPFPRRMYIGGVAYGEENMYLETQGYTLMLDELPAQRKQALYQAMRERCYDGEKLGGREQQTPEFTHEAFEDGSRENGGFWWSLNGPIVLGVATFDRAEAHRLLQDMTLQHAAEVFPEYWSTYWSAADNQESSLMPGEGLPDQTWDYPDFPVFCAHPHAWLLYDYLVLREAERAV